MAILWISPSKAHSGREEWIQQEVKRITSLWISPWKLYFDGFSTQCVAEVGIVIIDPKRIQHCYSFFLDYMNTSNNKAKYEALFIALEILIELGATEVEIYGDSELVINQLNGEYKYKHLTMAGNYLAATQLLNY
ncbi:hypothetical protein ACFX2I_007151 [Malus domestica]